MVNKAAIGRVLRVALRYWASAATRANARERADRNPHSARRVAAGWMHIRKDAILCGVGNCGPIAPAML